MQKLDIKQMRDYIIDMLIQQIMSGNLKDGDKLVQQAIADKAGLSRMPVREALQSLEQKGFVRFLPNRHVEVIGVTKTTIQSTFQVLIAIETEIANLIITNTEINCFSLTKILQLMHDATNKESLAKLELQFHLEFVRLIKNPYLENIQTKFLNGYFNYGIQNFSRSIEEICEPLKNITINLENKNNKDNKKYFEQYYKSLTNAMLTGGNYE